MFGRRSPREPQTQPANPIPHLVTHSGGTVHNLRATVEAELQAWERVQHEDDYTQGCKEALRWVLRKMRDSEVSLCPGFTSSPRPSRTAVTVRIREVLGDDSRATCGSVRAVV